MASPVSTKPGWRFGVFEVDARRGELRRSGVPLKLRDQSFQILLALLENPAEIVTRDELRHLLWPADTYVDFDHSLNTAMMKLREALGDSTEAPIYIETVPKRGYRFVAPVTCSGTLTHSWSHANDGGTSPISGAVTRAAAQNVPYTTRWMMAVGSLFLVCIGSITILWIHRSRASIRSQQASGFKIVPVTSAPGVTLAPAISPDGRMVAYYWEGPRRDRFELFVKLIGSELPRRRTYDSGRFGYPAWSPDGNEIAFVKCDLNNRGTVFIVPALEGEERRITDAGCPYSFPSSLAWSSEDGGRLVFVDHCIKNGPFGLVSFSLATGRRQCLTDDGPSGFDRRFAFSLSPDGKDIALISSTNAPCDIEVMPVLGGKLRRVLQEKHSCSELMWAPDGRAIIFRSLRTTLPSLWRVLLSSSEVKTEPIFPEIGRFSADGRRFVFLEETMTEPPSIWRTDLSGAGGKVLSNRKLISTQTSDLDAQPSPDGSQLVWASARTGTEEIWIGGANGENSRQLTRGESYAGTPRWSPDGRWITFDFNGHGEQIFMVDIEGRNLQPVTSGGGVNEVPNWSRDGKWIYFASKRTGRREVWKHCLESGEEVQVTTNGGFNPFESFDGKTIYFSRFEEPGIWSMPTQGGAEKVVVNGKPQALYWGYWALTKAGIYYLNVYAEPRTRIEYYDFSTRSSHPVLEIEGLPAWGHPSLSATTDGNTLFYGQQDFQGVVKLLEFSP